MVLAARGGATGGVIQARRFPTLASGRHVMSSHSRGLFRILRPRSIAGAAVVVLAGFALACSDGPTSPAPFSRSVSPPAFQVSVLVETVAIDTWAPSGSIAGPYFTTNVLAAGSIYEFTVVGTHSFWETGAWTTDCPHAEPNPAFPSPGTVNGQTAADPEYRFAQPPCVDDDPPVHQDLHFQFSLDGGATYAHVEPVDPMFNPDHTYTYRVMGQGERAAFRFVDGRINDNYGVFRTTVERILDSEPPVTSQVSADPNPVPVSTGAALAALVNDAATGGSAILTAEYSIDGGAFAAMQAADGSFDEVGEDVRAAIGPFGTAAVHDVCLRGTDAAGNVGAEQCILLAVYDPDAGFVTGAGWIDSPPAAYAPNPSLTGKATFGFVSRYQRGAAAPEGQTQFKFKVADLDFSSTSYEWLVIAGARAQYKGSGVINGMGDYGFLLTAIDGAVSGGGGVDRFRIKIWDEAAGTVVYDNQLGDSDTADPTTAIGRGSIVIHK